MSLLQYKEDILPGARLPTERRTSLHSSVPRSLRRQSLAAAPAAREQRNFAQELSVNEQMHQQSARAEKGPGRARRASLTVAPIRVCIYLSLHICVFTSLSFIQHWAGEHLPQLYVTGC